MDLVTAGTVAALTEGVSHDLDDSDSVLDGVVLPLEGEFAQWLALQRDRRRARVRRSLTELAAMAEAAKDWDDALAHAGELLALEPLSEEAHRRVMRLHYLAGNRSAALLAFDRCEQALKDEIGTRPSAERWRCWPPSTAPGWHGGAEGGRVPASVQRPPRLVGRDAEWAALHAAWDAATSPWCAAKRGWARRAW